MTEAKIFTKQIYYPLEYIEKTVFDLEAVDTYQFVCYVDIACRITNNDIQLGQRRILHRPHYNVDRTYPTGQQYHVYRTKIIDRVSMRFDSLILPKSTVFVKIYCNGSLLDILKNVDRTAWFKELPSWQAMYCGFMFEILCQDKIEEEGDAPTKAGNSSFAINYVFDSTEQSSDERKVCDGICLCMGCMARTYDSKPLVNVTDVYLGEEKSCYYTTEQHEMDEASKQLLLQMVRI